MAYGNNRQLCTDIARGIQGAASNKGIKLNEMV